MTTVGQLAADHCLWRQDAALDDCNSTVRRSLYRRPGTLPSLRHPVPLAGPGEEVRGVNVVLPHLAAQLPHNHAQPAVLVFTFKLSFLDQLSALPNFSPHEAL